MVCPFCEHIILLFPDAENDVQRACSACGAVMAIVIVSPPTISADELKNVRYPVERETYDAGGNRVPLPAGKKAVCAI